MKNAASKSINPCDICAVANFYATQLQLCCPHSPHLVPHACRVHALEIFNVTPLRMRDTVFYNAMITTHCHDDDGHQSDCCGSIL
ncbi:hypothetical protein RHMOL_Rhmol02G0096500 [Rhododendron molle]|uniref:Uncharacterized protein n=1 Tax=Rhododendron molle TaxID=49168 RepID=A0ACC0PN31_RHOML|nr:hypothetical protein RHMOL_Rhmol02G0096500 [Rhododendron molle]